jgi:hypothetical protein
LTQFELPPQQLPPVNVGPVKGIIFRWQHRRPVRDSEGQIIDPGPVLSEGIKYIHGALIPNSGLNWISAQMAGQVSGKSALLVNGTGSSAPTMGDTQMGGEVTGSGLTRTTGTTSGVGALVNLASGGATTQTTGSFAVGNTFTASGSVTVNEAGLGQDVIFNAGIIARDTLSPAATMASGDTLRTQFEIVL